MNFLLTSILCFLGPQTMPSTAINLGYPGGSLDERGWITPYLFQVTDQDIFLNDGNQLLRFNHEGIQKASFPLPNGYVIGNFTYIPQLELVAVSSLHRDESGAMTYRTFFTDRDGADRGIAYDESLADPRQVFNRQIMVTQNGRIIVNQWKPRGDYDNDTLQMREITLVPTQGIATDTEGAEPGYLIEYLSEPFHRQLFDPISVEAAFKHQYLTQRAGDNRLFTADQLTGRIQVMEIEGRDRIVKAGYLKLQPSFGRIEPFLHSDLTQKKPMEKVDHQKWVHSFSRVAGLYGLHEGFLVAWENPNPRHSWYANKYKKTPDLNASPYILILQKVDSYGREISSRELVNSVIMGVVERNVFVYQKNDGTHHVQVLSIDKL